MARRTDGERIDRLDDLTNTLSSRLDVLDEKVNTVVKTIEKWTTTSEGHASQLTTIEKQLLVLVDFKPCLEAVQAMKQDLFSVKNDLKSLSDWKAEVKREKDEASRRKAAYGPNVTAALISGAIAIIGIIVNILISMRK